MILQRLKLDDYYGQGRYTKREPPNPEPFYAHLQSHLEAEWRKWVHRNQEERQIRMMADGEISRWTRQARFEWGRRQHEEVMAGARPVPQGIGLSDVLPDPKGA